MDTNKTGKQLKAILESTEPVSASVKTRLILSMAFPAMCAQISVILMHYIDASMVGSLGAGDSAAIGIIASMIWLIGGVSMTFIMGFTIQVAQCIGAGKYFKARSISGAGFFVLLCVSLLIAFISTAIAEVLPVWLGAPPEISSKSAMYFMVSILGLPFIIMNAYAAGLLQATGNIKTPSMLNILLCVLDVLFNFIFIYPSHGFTVAGINITVPGFNLGVTGAALGTVTAEAVVMLMMLWTLLIKNEQLRFRREKHIIEIRCLIRAVRLAFPVSLDHLASTGAMVATVKIVAPLGIVSIASHSFAITAESFCYMIGYGTAHAASSIIGQCIGAKRKDLAWSFTLIITAVGVGLMSTAGVFMYIFAPELMGLLSPDPEIRKLGTAILRVEAFAEPLYAASILINGCFRGAGDTFIPGLMNIGSMWLVRIPLSVILAMYLGLYGVWIAMAVELCFRGLIFIARLQRKKWLNASDK